MTRRTLFLLAIALCTSMDASAAPSITKFGVTINNAAAVYPGNVLFVDCSPPNPDGAAVVKLIDPNGKELKAWRNQAMLDLVKPLGTDGTIVTWRRNAVSGTGCSQNNQKRSLYEVGPTNLVKKIYYDPTYGQNHDFEVLPDGTFMVIERKIITNTAVSAIPFFDEYIVHVDANGNVLWQWSTADHFSQLALSPQGLHMIQVSGGSGVGATNTDVFHTNNIQYIPPNPTAAVNPAFSAGNILVSQRNTNIIFVIDPSTGNIVWQVGNISIGQHHVRMIPSGLPGAGHLLLYNNGGHAGYPPLTQLWNSIDEYDPIGGTVVWSYTSASPSMSGLNSFWRGSAQRLPNGNTFIVEGEWGRFFEVDPAGNIVWEYLYQFPNKAAPDRNIYRAYKVEPCWPGCNPEISSTTQWTW